MVNKGYAFSRHELIRTLTAYSGITTDDGNIGGTTLRDRNLIGRNNFVAEKTILLMTGDAQDEDKGAIVFDNTTGIITLQSAVSAQIKAGTIFRVLNISSIEVDVGAMSTKIETNQYYDRIFYDEATGVAGTARSKGRKPCWMTGKRPRSCYF
ncbi:hypothetical protein ES705_48496 [subsurface metagenome]